LSNSERWPYNQRYYKKISIKAASLMALLSAPSLALSLYGALTDDAAFTPVLIQAFLVLMLVLAAIPALPLSYKQRLLVTVVVLFIAGAVATLRYANPTIGYTYTIIISLIVTLMLPRLAVYLVLAAMNIAVGVVAVLLFDLTPIRVALQFVTFTGTTAIGLEIIFTLIKYHSQQGEALEEEMARQQVVSSEANIAFMEFDYESGLLSGDATNAARFGRSESDGPVKLSDYAYLFPAESWEIMQSMIAKFSQQPAGSVVNFTHYMTGVTDNNIHHYRVTGVNMMRHGRLQFVGVSADVTEESRISKVAENLTDQINLVSNAGGVGLIEFFPGTRTFTCNSEVAKRLGIDDSVEERSIELFYAHQTEDIRQAFITLREELVLSDKGELQSFVHPFYLANGDLHYYRVTRIRREHNGRVSFLGLSLDITDEINSQKSAQQKNQLLDLMADSGNFGFFEVDLEAGTMTGNKILMAREGLSETDTVGMDQVLSKIPEEERAGFNANVQHAIEAGIGAVTSFTHSYQPVNSDPIVVKVVATTLLKDDKLFAFGTSIDVIEEHKAKEKAESASQKLLAEQERQKQMYAVIGHELRTPAASLQMMLDDLEEGETLDCALVGSNIEHLIGVIDTLRAVAQPERMAQSAFKDVVMNELLTAQVANLSGLADRSGIELTADLSNLTSEPVHVQSSLLRQVTANLIKNAIIHSGGDKVHLHASNELKGDNTKALTIRISDNGKGIPDSKLESLFEAYQRGDTNAEGTGLGLFVCKEILDLMGGGIHYEPSEQGGAEFVIDLVVELAKEGKQESDASNNSLEGKRILIAEDNDVIRMLTVKMLQKQGSNVTACSNGQEALNTYQESAFDLVLSDIFMPELDGYGFVKGLREQGYTGPIVGLTAATIGAETDLMLEAGADIVISKPIELSKLQTFLLEYDKQTKK
jgi:CheY-like chemotaxis protein/nitrogen-specific signal transduction histidine kinase/PAS domain-containing protein